MLTRDKYARYDIAKSRLRLMVGHYAELIRDELKKTSPNQTRIAELEAAQDALDDTDSLLSVDDASKVESIIAAYEETIAKIMERR
jgi:hypothetical protein